MSWGQVQRGVHAGTHFPLPTQVLNQVLDTAFLAYGNRVWVGSGMILTLGFLWRVQKEKWAFVRGETDQPDYWRHAAALAGYVALISAYQPFARACINVVVHLAQGLISQDELGPALQARAQAMEASWDQTRRNVAWGLNFFVDYIMLFSAPMFFIVASWVVWSLKCLQTFILAVIVVYGPIALSFSFMGGIFSGLGTGWFMALVEISAWSFTLDILNFILTPMVRAPTDEYLLTDELGLGFVMITVLHAVPKVTAMLVRSAGAGLHATGLPLGAALRAVEDIRKRTGGQGSRS